MHPVFQALAVILLTSTCTCLAEDQTGMCRFSSGEYYKPDLFNDIACCKCYETLFQSIATVGVGFCNWTSLTIGEFSFDLFKLKASIQRADLTA